MFDICKFDPLETGKELSHQQRKALNPLNKHTMVEAKAVEDPRNFKDAPMITTFVRLVERRACQWSMVMAEKVVSNVKLADWKHQFLKKTLCELIPDLYSPHFL